MIGRSDYYERQEAKRKRLEEQCAADSLRSFSARAIERADNAMRRSIETDKRAGQLEARASNLGTGGTPDQLADIGRALYGNAWQTDMAAGLNIAVRSVQRFAAGEHPIHAGIASDLLNLVDQRADDLASVRKTLRAAARSARASA